MSRLPAAVAELRVAVRRELADLSQGALVLAACSGGADSLALAATLGFVASRMGLRAGVVTVDHGLQQGSARRAHAVADWAKRSRFDPVEMVAVKVGTAGGPEAAARAARYQALDDVATRSGAAAIVLGHTRDDQAETVLLALARGAGLRGIAGMPARRGVYRRPLLGVARSVTRQACLDLGLEVWDDPHNTDPSYARARVRELMPGLERALGDGVVANLARTARLAGVDSEVLEELSGQVLDAVRGADGSLDIAGLESQPEALRTRALHRWARWLGCSGSALSTRHVDALQALVTAWSGQGPVHLPGGVVARREQGRLIADRPPGADPHS